MKNTAARIELEQGCELEEQEKFELAFEFYLKAAKHGSIEAQVNLAHFYDEGKGCEKDSQKAVYWYKRAYKLGCPQGAYNLGIHYRQEGKQRWAKYWFERAVDMGYEDARIEIEKLILQS